MELFPSEDRFYNLYDLGAGDIEDQYLPWKWKQGVTPSGQMIGFPMDTGPTALFYREDLFKEAGLPSDPEDVTRQINSWDAYADAGEQAQGKIRRQGFSNRQYCNRLQSSHISVCGALFPAGRVLYRHGFPYCGQEPGIRPLLSKRRDC